MELFRTLRARRTRRLVDDQQSFYGQAWTQENIRHWQLDQLNAQWALVQRHVPYYRRLMKAGTLPRQFSSRQQFSATVPLLQREVLQRDWQLLRNPMYPVTAWRTTGGSTAEPIRVPICDSEREVAGQDMWYARDWFGVGPADRLFLIWGQSHLLGTGWRGRWNGLERRLKDTALGYCRHSAYDLSVPSLQAAADKLIAFRPRYVMGYAVALDMFARANASRREELHRLDLKVAIATAEGFPRPDSMQIISDILGCPVAMEYGTVETGPIAHQQINGRYATFWRHYLIEGIPSPHVPAAWELLVTSLYPRCVPLLRYPVGDLISTNPNDADFGQEIDAITGRCNDYIVLHDGSVVHSEGLTHAIKEIGAIAGFQAVQSANGDVAMRYTAAHPLQPDDLALLRRRLRRVHPGLVDLRIDHVDALAQTIAGKTRRIRRE